MQRTFTLLIVALLLAGPVSAQVFDTPPAILKLAVKRTKLCDFTVEKFVPEDGKDKLVPLSEEDAKKAAEIFSLPMIFREGRFSLDFGPDDTAVDQRAVYVITFVPWESSTLPPIQGEDERVTRTVNQLRGTVTTDRGETPVIVGIDALLAKSVWYTLADKFSRGPAWKILELQDVKLTFEQRFVNDRWYPRVFSFDLKYKPRVGKVGYVKYAAKFRNCTPPTTATK